MRSIRIRTPGPGPPRVIATAALPEYLLRAVQIRMRRAPGSCVFRAIIQIPVVPTCEVRCLTPTLKILTLALLAFCSGCNTHTVKVDALSKPDAEKSVAYQIRTTNPDLDPDSLRYKEAERFVKTALSGKGMYESPSTETADMIVNLDYGISPPKVTREMRSEPIYQTVPGRVSTQTVQVGVDKNGNAIYSTVIVQEPSSVQYVGERDYFVTIVTYEKHLRISARENKPASEGRPPAELWTVDVTTEGESHDLRKALPVLAAATIEYVGRETRGQQTIKLKDTKDGAIAFVKKGM
jgi:hypothetical protein